ncbi:Hint domain-containing protein [Ruegeria arenilitoris]|uniref:Hint domain-containing protein n=1 Tax=Ruegeria arenilitoris TaxID=1173585 RepID=UPI00148080B7|nr:Hint domain-containing protein [Ruegeria arenilitoris]
MVVYYGYQNAILGTQSTVNGGSVDYGVGPSVGATWSWSGTSTNFTVKENDGAVNFNGDGPGNGLSNEEIAAQEQIGGQWQQTIEVGGTDRQAIWDYTFEVTASDGTVYRVAVIDVDLNNDDDVGINNNSGDPGEDGYFLVFPDGIPPAGTDLTVGNIVENGPFVPHADLGAQVVCFCRGTVISTVNGPTKIEDLSIGDLVLTKNNGPQVLRWIGSRIIDLTTCGEAAAKLRPIHISAGALGHGLPARDLLVSRQHRMLVSSKISERMFGCSEVLVAATKLTELPGIFVDMDVEQVEYFHLMFDQHELVFAEGAPSESLYTGPEALKAVSDEAREEILTIFPEVADLSFEFVAACPIPAGRLQKKLVERHVKNGKLVLETFLA